MSNLLLLAQTTLPSADPVPTSLPTTGPSGLQMMLPLPILFGLIYSGWAVLKQRLYTLAPLPLGPEQPGVAVLGGALLAGVAAFIAGAQLGGMLLGLTPGEPETPERLRLVMMAQPFAHAATIGVILFVLYPWLPQTFQWRQTSRGTLLRQSGATYLLALPWVFLAAFVVQLIVQAMDLKADTSHKVFELWREEPEGVTPLKSVLFLAAVIGAPISEELIFRGLIQRAIQRLVRNPYIGIAVASILFALTHQPWPTQPPIFVLSLFLGVLYFRTGTILAPILAHAMFNLMQLVLFFSGLFGE